MEGPTRPPRRGRKPKNPITTEFIHPDVWALALILADHKLKRLERVGGAVIVHNHERLGA